MSKYKEETTNIMIRSQGWSKDITGTKHYHKDNWVISYYGDTIFTYWIIDKSYPNGYYSTFSKQPYLEELRMLKVKDTLVWKALHGEYDNE